MPKPWGKLGDACMVVRLSMKGIKHIVAQELIQGHVEPVAAGLGDQIDYVAS